MYTQVCLFEDINKLLIIRLNFSMPPDYNNDDDDIFTAFWKTNNITV